MANKTSLADPDSEINYERLARKELAQLQRQYRVMETDRQSFVQGKGRNVSHYHRMLESLQLEKEDLSTDIHNVLSKTNEKKNKNNEFIITKMMEIYFKCAEQIHAHIQEINEMETQVDKITKRVIAQKLKTQHIFGQALTIGQTAKRLRVLESSKYHVTTLFDTKSSENNFLRDDINQSLIERGKFHERYNQLKRKIVAVKHKMLSVVDNALTTYESREESVMKIQTLRERNDKESIQHVLEIKEYQRVFHNDHKIKKFMKVKNRDREVVEKTEERSYRLSFDKEKQLEQLIRQYKKNFSRLFAVARTNDVETLVHHYLTQEQVNFSSFKYITDLNNQTYILHEGIWNLKIQIENVVAKSKKNRGEQLINLKTWTMTQEKDETELKRVLESCEMMEEKISKIIHAVDVIFDRAGCENAPIIQLLGNRPGILPRNLILCLKVLEQRIGELKYQKSILELKKAIVIDKIDKNQLPVKQGYWQPGTKPLAAGGPYRPKVILTGISNDDDEDDEENEKQMSMRRMTHHELVEVIRTKMQDKKQLEFPYYEVPSHLESFGNIQAKPKFGLPIRQLENNIQFHPVTGTTSNENKSSSIKTVDEVILTPVPSSTFASNPVVSNLDT